MSPGSATMIPPATRRRARPAAGFRRSVRLPMEASARCQTPRGRTLRHLCRTTSASSSTARNDSITRCSSSRRPAGRPRAPIAFLCSTNTWKAYAATAFSPTWKGIKKSIGNNGFANSPATRRRSASIDPIAPDRAPIRWGFRMPWPIAGPYTRMGPEEWDYSHLCRQDRFTQVWLEAQGYDYDVLSDSDMHLDPRFSTATRSLFVVGHSEYWSFEAMEAVIQLPRLGRQCDRALGQYGVLAGLAERRRQRHRVPQRGCAGDAGPRRPSRRDVAQPSTAGAAGCRGNAGSRPGDCSAWNTSRCGSRMAKRGPVQGPDAGPFPVPPPPRPEAAKDGDSFGGTPGGPLPQPIGHEGDVRVSTLAKFLVETAAGRAAQLPLRTPPESPSWPTGSSDRRQRWLRLGLLPAPLPAGKVPLIPVAAEMIYWERPGGGRVFHAGSINAGSTLAARPEVGRPVAQRPGSLRREAQVSSSREQDPTTCLHRRDDVALRVVPGPRPEIDTGGARRWNAIDGRRFIAQAARTSWVSPGRGKVGVEPLEVPRGDGPDRSDQAS